MDGGKRVRDSVDLNSGASKKEHSFASQIKSDEDSFFDIWKQAIASSQTVAKGEEMELELKFGKMNGEVFVADMGEDNFTLLSKVLTETYSWTCIPAIEQVSTDYALSCKDRKDFRRVSYVEGSGFTCLTKSRKSTAVYDLVKVVEDSEGWAIKASLSSEQHTELPSEGNWTQAPPACFESMKSWDIVTERKKHRRTFWHKSGRCVFKIDMTRVRIQLLLFSSSSLSLHFSHLLVLDSGKACENK